MKRIKRTITIKKVEFISNQKNDHDHNFAICPLCHSTITALPPAKDSAVEIPAAEIPFQLTGQPNVIEIKGDDNE